MSSDMTVHATLTAGMRFEAETASGHHLVLDDTANQRVQDAAPSPLEMLLASLAGCSGISMLSILRKKRQDITRYEIHVSAKQAETYPHVFTEIHVEHTLIGNALREEVMQRALQLTEERYCSISSMLSKTTMLTQTVRIVKEE